MPKPSVPLSFEQYENTRYFAGLNGIRCFAATAVVWHHTVIVGSRSFFAHGHMGVDVFFVLSGFLITTLLLREKANFGRISLVGFWMRRALRLFPAYYGLLLAMAAMYLLLKPHDPDFVKFYRNVHIYALYASNWLHPDVHDLGQTWTLATEEQFYVFWPLVEAFTRPVVTGAIWIAAVIANQLMNFGLFDHALRSAGLMDVGRLEIAEVTFTPILLGVGLAHLLHRSRSFAIVRRLAGWTGAPLVYLAGLCLILALGLPTLDGVPRLTTHLLITLMLAALVVRPAGRTARLLEWRPFEYLGTISYGIYLYHMVPTAFAGQLLGPRAPWLVFPVTLVVTVIIAGLSYRLFEQPLLRLGKRFRQVPIIRDPALNDPAAPIPQASAAH